MFGMWNLKTLSAKVLFRAIIGHKKNVRMASKKISTDEKPKVPKKGFFRRSESVMPDNYSKTASDSTSLDALSNDSDNKKICRSSMICSESFDKYTFDCHRQGTPAKSVGPKLDNVTTSHGVIYTQNQSSSEKDVSFAQPSTPVSVEQTVVRKLSPFKPLSVTTTVKNPPVPFKRVPEETIPINIPISSKRLPITSAPFADTHPNNVSPKSPATSIPLSFNPVHENPSKISNTTVSFADTRPINISPKSPLISIPLSFNPVPDGLNKKVNVSALKNSSMNSAPVKNSPFTFKNFSDEHGSVQYSPSSFKHVTEKSRPVTKAFSFRNASNDISSSRNSPVSSKFISSELGQSIRSPLSFKYAPKQTISSNYVVDEPIPIRSTPLSLKSESVSLRNIPSSLKHIENKSSSPTRNIALSLQPVPEESVSTGDSAMFRRNTSDEPIPFRNSPLTLKPNLTKHMSLLKKKTPSFKGHIIKRDSVVHPGRIDMQSSLFIDGRFQNPWPTWRPPTFANILKFGVTRNKSKVPTKQELDLILPIVKQNFSKLTIPEDGIRVTWIGHSSVLVQMHGLNILTDPIFSDRASPSQVVGPKRYRDPPCTIHDLPHINAVVISHTHYDHLDHNTVTLLNARFGSDLRWFVPLGLQAWMEQVGCENVVELDWWEENCVPEHSDTSFIFTPAQHWSKRTIADDNKVLWGSWCILGPKYKFFFAGDTGYCEVFKQIGRVHGPFDLSAIPIGAYEPRWFMKYQHINPEEAVKIHMDIKSKRSLAIHWGTFSLANEYYLDPPVKLRESLDKCEIPPELFFTLKHGESRLIAQNNLVKRQPLSERNGK